MKRNSHCTNKISFWTDWEALETWNSLVHQGLFTSVCSVLLLVLTYFKTFNLHSERSCAVRIIVSITSGLLLAHQGWDWMLPKEDSSKIIQIGIDFRIIAFMFVSVFPVLVLKTSNGFMNDKQSLTRAINQRHPVTRGQLLGIQPVQHSNWLYRSCVVS